MFYLSWSRTSSDWKGALRKAPPTSAYLLRHCFAMRKAVARCRYRAKEGIYTCATISEMPKGGGQRLSAAVLNRVFLINETLGSFHTAESANSGGAAPAAIRFPVITFVAHGVA